jgi:serine/threonine protein kinase
MSAQRLVQQKLTGFVKKRPRNSAQGAQEPSQPSPTKQQALPRPEPSVFAGPSPMAMASPTPGPTPGPAPGPVSRSALESALRPATRRIPPQMIAPHTMQEKADLRISQSFIPPQIGQVPENVQDKEEQDPNILQLCGQTYNLTKFLGQGSFGEIFEAKRQSDGQIVAIKEVSLKNSEAEESHKKEFQILQKIRDFCNMTPMKINVSFICLQPEMTEECAFQKSSQPGSADTMHFVMNKVEGMEIRDYLKRIQRNKSRMRYSTFIKIALRIAKGIQIMHENNLVHNDLKIENIMINPKNKKITIIDFGFSCMAEDRECLSLLRGTPIYFDPHAQYYGEQSGDWGSFKRRMQVDVWAFGMTVIHLLIIGSVNIPSVNNGELNILYNSLETWMLTGNMDELKIFVNTVNKSQTLPKFLKKCLTFDINERTKDGTELFNDVSSELCFNKILNDSIAFTKGSIKSKDLSNSYCFQLVQKLPEKHFLKKKVLEQLRTQKESESGKLAKYQEFTENLILNLDRTIQLLQEKQ